MNAVVTLVTIMLAAQVAAADGVTGVVFVAQPVRAPVAPDRVAPVAPFVPDGVDEQTGELEVGPDRAAALWLDALDVIRIRKLAGAGSLRFARVVGAGGTRAQLDEPGATIAPGVSYLAQPPGGGDVWMIWARQRATIRVERPIARAGRLIWDVTQRALLAWVDATGGVAPRPAGEAGRVPTPHRLASLVDGGGDRPPLPITEGAYAAALELDTDEVIGRAVEAAFPKLRPAVRAWRKADVIAQLTAVRPLVVPQLRVDLLDDLAGMTGDVTVPDPSSPDPRPYHHVSGAHKYELELEGPGVLRVEARAVLPAPQAGVSNVPELPDVSIAVTAAGHQLGRRTVAAAYAAAPDEHVPPRAFPSKQPLTSREGDYLGDRVAVAVPLFPGRHAYHIAIEGGELALRAAVGRRRARLGEAIGGRDDVDRLLREALDAVGDDHSPGAALVHNLVAVRQGSRGHGKPPAQLSSVLSLAWLVAASDPGDRDTLVAARRALAATKGTEVWPLVLALARRLGDGDAVRELYAAAPGAPPAALIPDLVALLPRSTLLERIRNWPLTATMLATRALPIDPTVAGAARARWRTGEWEVLRPALRDPDVEPPPPQRWLVEATPQPLAPPRGWRVGDLTRLQSGRTRTITALPSAVDPTRAALLDVFLATTDQDPGPLEVTVDRRRFHTLALAPIERLQIAVAPGPHEVAIAGPRALRGWVSQVPTASVGVADRARVHALWPTEVDGGRLIYALPASDLPIEVAFRAVGPIGKPLHVGLHFDVGPPIELTLTKGSIDAGAHAFDSTRAKVTDEMRFVVWPATGARAVWFETDSPSRVVASVATRRDNARDPEQAIGGKPSALGSQTSASAPRPASDLLERVARASKQLASDPDDVRARSSRASDLLDLGEVSLAREDLLRLLRVPAARQGAASGALESELFMRLDDFNEPTHVALVGAVDGPIAVAPTLVAVATASNLGAHRSAAVALRTKGPDEALRALGGKDDPIASAIAARALAARGDQPGAARALVRVYQRTDRWPAGLEALDVLARAIVDRKQSPGVGMIAITYGIAARVRAAIDHPRVRRALVVAAAQSGWDTLTAMSTSAGHETLLVTQPILPPAPSVLVREALLAPSWPARAAHTLTAGTAGVLDLAVPASASLHAQIHCVRTRDTQLTPDEANAPCSLSARIDNGSARALTAPIGKTIDVPLQQVGAGRHVLEIALAAASEPDVASVRFTSERALANVTEPALADGQFPVRIERRAKVFVASTTTPVTATVQGPTTLWVQARSLGGGGNTAEVSATPRQGEPVRATLELAAERDNDARGDDRDLVVATPSDVFLVLPDAQPYSIAVRPDRGRLVTRVALRDERPGKVPRWPGAWYVVAPLAKPPFPIATPAAVARVDGPLYDESSLGRLGTFSVDLRIGRDSRPEEDLPTVAIAEYAEAGVGFRRALSPDRYWLAARAGARIRENTALITTASAELYLDQLLLGTTLELGGTAFAQEFSDGTAFHVRGYTQLSRRWDLSDTFSARPAVGFAASYLNTTPAIAAIAIDQIDPDVYNNYRYAHRRDATASLAAHWTPLQDFTAYVGAAVTTNAEIVSIDHAGFNVGVRTLVPLPLVGETLLAASYGPNYRFADPDRVAPYWRHDVGMRVEFNVWTTTQGRFDLVLSDDYYPGAVNALGAALRFDLVRNRGLADFAPNDQPFATLVEHRMYAPLEAP